MTPDDIRRKLKDARRRKLRAEAIRERAVQEQRDLIAAARETPGTSVAEAARILGVSSRMAWKMLDSA